MCFDRDVPVSPYAVSTQTGDMTKSKRPKSAVALHHKKKDIESSRALASHGKVPFMAWDEPELVPRTIPTKKRPTSASSTRSRFVSAVNNYIVLGKDLMAIMAFVFLKESDIIDK